jgi:hypothetical protein
MSMLSGAGSLLRNVRCQSYAPMKSESKALIQQHLKDIRCLATQAVDDRQRHLLAEIQFLIAEEQSKSAEKLGEQMEHLTGQTSKLVGQVVELVSIAAEQKRLAAKLDTQTDRLVSLTVWLKGLTIGLLILTLVLCFFEAFRFIEVGKNPVQVRPHMQQTNQDTHQSTNH